MTGAGEEEKPDFNLIEQTAMFIPPFSIHEKAAHVCTVDGFTGPENQCQPIRASEVIVVAVDYDHSRKSGVSSMVEWGGNSIPR